MEWAQSLIDKRQYVLDSDWGEVQPRADAQNAYLETHDWADYAHWHLGLTEGANDETKARYAFVYGDFRRVHRSGLIACVYRAVPSGGTRPWSWRPTGCCSGSTRRQGSACEAAVVGVTAIDADVSALPVVHRKARWCSMKRLGKQRVETIQVLAGADGAGLRLAPPPRRRHVGRLRGEAVVRYGLDMRRSGWDQGRADTCATTLVADLNQAIHMAKVRTQEHLAADGELPPSAGRSRLPSQPPVRARAQGPRVLRAAFSRGRGRPALYLAGVGPRATYSALSSPGSRRAQPLCSRAGWR